MDFVHAELLLDVRARALVREPEEVEADGASGTAGGAFDASLEFGDLDSVGRRLVVDADEHEASVERRGSASRAGGGSRNGDDERRRRSLRERIVGPGPRDADPPDLRGASSKRGRGVGRGRRTRPAE